MEHVTLSDLDAEPHAVVYERGPKTVRLSLDAGERMPEHDHPGRDVLFHVLDGTIEVAIDGDAHELDAGDVLRFDGERTVAPEAVTDARALVVLAARAETRD
jgi:mannose-6-phosphate isomerase-like protein (cupin superfamily)